jgi:hypothetical protein
LDAAPIRKSKGNSITAYTPSSKKNNHSYRVVSPLKLFFRERAEARISLRDER